MADAQRMMGQKGTGLLGQMFDVATNIMNTCSDPVGELKKYGVSRDTIKRAKSCLNFPGVGWLVNKYGDKNKILEDLEKLEKVFEENQPLIEQAPVSELEQMQRNLASLK